MLLKVVGVLCDFFARGLKSSSKEAVEVLLELGGVFICAEEGWKIEGVEVLEVLEVLEVFDSNVSLLYLFV